jgi:Voltage gated chloride channel/CBS domain
MSNSGKREDKGVKAENAAKKRSWQELGDIGFMARYGSERIRGHGIPEAIEAILINGSRVEPKVALLKPISSAISIGSGGPFGAEGPIIMTGGAFGSMIAQLFHLTSAERKPLGDVVRSQVVSAYSDEPLRVVVYRMAEKGFTRMPVVERETRKFLGLVSLDDLLKARARHLEEERRREQTLRLRFLWPGSDVGDKSETLAAP